jgi:hypothetical protein
MAERVTFELTPLELCFYLVNYGHNFLVPTIAPSPSAILRFDNLPFLTSIDLISPEALQDPAPETRSIHSAAFDRIVSLLEDKANSVSAGL